MVASSIAALFDLDGTLYTGHIATAFRVHHQTQRVKRLQTILYFAAHVPIWWLVRAGLLSDEAMRRVWTQDMGWLVAGWRVEEAQVAFEWIAENYVLPLVRESILERAHAHQRQGQRTILVSGTPTQLLEVIGRAMGIREVVGTPLVVKNGRYTGASQRPVCQGVNKVRRVQEHAGDESGIDWGQSYAYADSILDLPLLKKVGHPVAVCPDAALKAYARSHQWEILE
ncbi:MAG TPA: HAD family hydrolase [Anaerolineae bacterium]|nr:HAD family hydrolase [Anaerolineae bacterium]